MKKLLVLAAVLLVQNWVGTEKKIEQQLPRLYESDDREFRRSLSSLLGPQIVDGNKVETLLNGDQIFPSMLAAIRAAIAEAADLLGNTVSVARSSYVDPRVVDLFEDGHTIGRVRSENGVDRAVVDLLTR